MGDVAEVQTPMCHFDICALWRTNNVWGAVADVYSRGINGVLTSYEAASGVNSRNNMATNIRCKNSRMSFGSEKAEA